MRTVDTVFDEHLRRAVQGVPVVVAREDLDANVLRALDDEIAAFVGWLREEAAVGVLTGVHEALHAGAAYLGQAGSRRSSSFRGSFSDVDSRRRWNQRKPRPLPSCRLSYPSGSSGSMSGST